MLSYRLLRVAGENGNRVAHSIGSRKIWTVRLHPKSGLATVEFCVERSSKFFIITIALTAGDGRKTSVWPIGFGLVVMVSG